jgi:UDP-N-acetylmuramoyl-L-alanyl-D-glutamate--2,6-diaminopimelate ligase
MKMIRYKDSIIVIDFAHTPDAISSVTKSLKESYPDYRLVTLFGCGGDRDKRKRPLMAKAAEQYSDAVILTSDNPRYEEPESIMADASTGFSDEQTQIVDRKEAIKFGLKNLKSKTVLLIAGKGHEDYIDIKGVKHSYSDEKVVTEFINDQS